MEDNNSKPNEGTHSKIINLIKNHQKHIDQNDTESVWFSAAEIKALLSHNHVNGIRVYFARHDASHPTYPDRKTVVILPTTDHTDPQKPSPENSEDILSTGAQTAANFQVAALDSGTLCPPRCSK